MKNKTNIILKVGQIMMALLFVSYVANSQQMISSNTSKSGCNNTDYNFTITQGSLNNNCYFDIGFRPVWTTSSMDCNVGDLPHGLYVEFTGATINNASNIDSWLLSAQRSPSVILGSNYIYWNKEPLGNCANAINAIPSITNPLTPRTVRIWVTPTSNSVTVIVKNLQGPSWPAGWLPPNDPNDWLYPNIHYTFWNCGITQTFLPPQPQPHIVPVGEVCLNHLIPLLTISPLPPAGSSVQWYYSTNDPCPTINPQMTGWETPPYQGNTFNAGYATASNYCFVAVIKTGCFTYYPNLNITVCDGPPSAIITATPNSPYTPLIPIGSENHACEEWNGTLTLNPLPFLCNTTVTWQKRHKYYDGLNWLTWSGWANWFSGTTIQTSPLYNDNKCAKMIEYKAKMHNVCGDSYASFFIVIDKKPEGGYITTLDVLPNNPNPGPNYYINHDIGSGTIDAPIVCKETRLKLNSSCGKPDHWEFSEKECNGTFSPLWQVIPGSIGTYQWWTNPYPLSKTTRYRVLVKNGACSSYSNEIIVTVIPDPTVTISANTNLICPGSNPVLTAAINFPPECMPGTYNWYYNGVLINGASSPTYSPTLPGDYFVIFKNNPCGKIAQSNVISICMPKVTISAPCCICLPTPTYPGETITLTANFVNMDACIGSCTPIYLWSTGATTQQISVTQPGIYSVTATCGSCIQTASITVIPCP
jgi:hypothetical protein